MIALFTGLDETVAAVRERAHAIARVEQTRLRARQLTFTQPKRFTGEPKQVCAITLLRQVHRSVAAGVRANTTLRRPEPAAAASSEGGGRGDSCGRGRRRGIGRCRRGIGRRRRRRCIRGQRWCARHRAAAIRGRTIRCAGARRAGVSRWVDGGVTPLGQSKSQRGKRREDPQLAPCTPAHEPKTHITSLVIKHIRRLSQSSTSPANGAPTAQETKEKPRGPDGHPGCFATRSVDQPMPTTFTWSVAETSAENRTTTSWLPVLLMGSES